MITQVASMIRQIKGPQVGAIEPDSRLFEDLGFDSLQLLELIEALQSNLGIVFAAEDYAYENFADVGSIMALIDRYNTPKP